jgi:hypothetical protein
LKRALILAACLAVAAVVVAAASAAPVDPASFTCGITVFTPCNQSAHFSTPDPSGNPVVGTPMPGATNCPAYVQNDAVLITGTGNGNEHSIVNKNGDGWFTSTFTGTVTLVPYTADAAGNPVAPDPAAPTLTGHMTEWFGGSFNAKNFVVHDTININATGSDNSTLTLHVVDHTSVPAAAGSGPVDFHIASCG